MTRAFIAAIAVAILFAAQASARTIPLQGIHLAKEVAATCKRYGGMFSSSRRGHSCAKTGYGTVICSKAGICVARLEDGFKLARK